MTGDPDYRDESVLRELYIEQKMSMSEIADEFDVHQTTILKYLHRNGIPTRSEGRQRTASAKVRTDSKGHERVQNREPDGSVVHVKVHRLAAVAWFGYDAVAGNVVHHSDPTGENRPGVPWDNRESVLETMTASEHGRHHASQQPWMTGRNGA